MYIIILLESFDEYNCSVSSTTVHCSGGGDATVYASGEILVFEDEHHYSILENGDAYYYFSRK